MELILIILAVVILVGALPTWGYSRDWGYMPIGSILAIILIIWLITYIV